MRPAALALFWALAVLAGGSRPAAAVEAHSNHGAAFLRVGVHARYLGLGSVGAALANDAGAGYWNPAGLALLRGISVTGMITGDLDFGRRHGYAAVAYGTEGYALALSWITAGSNDLVRTAADGSTLGTFDFGENAVLLSVARRGGGASIGATGKLLTQSLGAIAPGGGDDDLLGVGLDLGAQFFLTEFVRLGVSVQDLVTRIGKTTTGDVNKIPSNLRLGVALEPAEGLDLGLDLEKTRDEDPYRLHAGGEYKVPLGNDVWGTIRLGVDDGKFAGGFGGQVGVVHFDYAYVVEPQPFLDENHRFSLTLDFSHRREVVRAGAEKDTDMDGFPDDQDACPDQAEDFDGFEDFDGCPDEDNDGDGIPDAVDQCPDAPEDFDGVADADGCPDP